MDDRAAESAALSSARALALGTPINRAAIGGGLV